jgi:putative glutamine amidotransferase
LIGLPGRRKYGRQIADIPDVLHDAELDLYFANYTQAVIAAGGLPVHLPLDADPIALADRLDGVLLTGGTDLDASRYGADPHVEMLSTEPARDDFELALFGTALDRGVPVLGICRGIQVINVHQGGTLHQHVPSHSRFDLAVSTTTHSVMLHDGSQLRRLFGETLDVNSLHHQSVADVGRDIEVTATADDGGIEGLEMGDAVLAVQWHPEMMSTRCTDPLFRWLVERASA